MKVVKEIIKINIFLFIVIVLSIQLVSAKTTEYKAKFCTLSKEYIEWEKLSKKKKENTIMPPMCDPTKDELKIKKDVLLKQESLPVKYDIREQEYKQKIKNQKDTGSCWAFSTTSALEILMQKQFSKEYLFSPRHIVYSSTRTFLNGKINPIGYNNPLNSGGNFFMSSNYLINNVGPVSEEDMPFENNENLIDIQEISGKDVQLDINNMTLAYRNTPSACTSSEITEIKKYIYEYGAVVMSTYINNNYYNTSTSSYYYNGTATPNHAATIVGWDDNYSKDKFLSSSRPKNNGAWIVQNSYGETFGQDGYYYVSYEDMNVCNFYMAIRETDNDVEDHMYVLDVLGFNGFIGYTQDEQPITTAYAMNVFNKKTNTIEVLKEVSFGSNGAGTYEIYYSEGNASTKEISDMTLIGTGTTDTRGYFTHKLDEEILLDTDIQNFSIAISYNMETSTVPIALSASNATFYQYITLDNNTSFISPDGSTWQDLKTISQYTYIASIKASTDNYIKTKSYVIDEENKIVYIDSNTSVDKFVKEAELSSTTLGEITSTNGKMYTGQKVGPYTAVIKGDVTGDGYARMNDVMMISKYIVDGEGLEENYYKLAADVIKDSKVKMNDVMRISQFIVEGGTL